MHTEICHIEYIPLWPPPADSEPVLHPVREVVQPAHDVGWQALVDLLGVGQVEAGHDLDELLPGLGQAGVVLLLLPDRAASLACG